MIITLRRALQACGRLFSMRRRRREPLPQPQPLPASTSTLHLYLTDEDWQELYAYQERVMEDAVALGADAVTQRFRANLAHSGNWLWIYQATKVAEAEVARLRSWQ
ncbi:hypothetical protein MMC07_007828, partial [Pseudocyphellaria aurata]|nr:hypothetical protein [Pseudocyphellaria aurata]